MSPDAAWAEADEFRVGERSTFESNIYVQPEWAAEKSHAMPPYLISFDAHAMDYIPDEDMPTVTTPRSRC